MTAIDYRLTDSYADPVGSSEQFYTERLYRLPQSNWCFTEIEDSPAIVPPPVLRNGYLTFGSFNNLAKVTDPMIEIWAKILRSVPNSRVLMKASALSSADARKHVIQTFGINGVDMHRLELSHATPDYHSHLAAYGTIDIALDTFPYNGTTTTCEAIWMGVPVITLSGQDHHSRVGSSLLTNIGRPELIASTPERYIALATELANDPDFLKTRRIAQRVQMRSTPLMDASKITREIETAFRYMWLESSMLDSR